MLLKHLRSKLPIKNLVIYGRSLGGHVAKALSQEADVCIFDRTYSSISLLPRFRFGNLIQRIFDLSIDNYQTNNSNLLETEAKKIIMYDPKNDDVVPYLASLTFGITVELANLFFNKASRADLEQPVPADSRCRRAKNAKTQQAYYGRQRGLLAYGRLLLGRRDADLLFAALKRLVKLCLARAVFSKQSDRPQALVFDLEHLPSESDQEPLDHETFTNLHSNRLSDTQYLRLTDPKFDYSQQLESISIAGTGRLIPIIDSIFEALSFVETGGLQLPAIFVMGESEQTDAFQAFVLSLVFWGSSLPLSAFVKSRAACDVLTPLRLAQVRSLLSGQTRWRPHSPRDPDRRGREPQT